MLESWNFNLKLNWIKSQQDEFVYIKVWLNYAKYSWNLEYVTITIQPFGKFHFYHFEGWNVFKEYDLRVKWRWIQKLICEIEKGTGCHLWHYLLKLFCFPRG